MVRPPKVAARGRGIRSAASRRNILRLCAVTSHSPADRHRRDCRSTADHGGKTVGSSRYGTPVLLG